MSSKKKTKTTQQTILDPLTQQLSEMRLAQEKRIQPLREQSIGLLQNLLEPGRAGATGTGGLAGSPFDEGSLAFATPEERAAFERLRNLADPAMLEKAAKTTLSNIIAPELESQLTAAGMGRSGAIGEALAKEGTRMALPIAAEARAASGGLANWLSGVAGRRQETAAGLADPSRMLFAQAPTQVATAKQKGSWMDWLAPAAGLLAAPFTGGGSLAGSIASGVSGLFGGGGTSSGWQAPSFSYQPDPRGFFYGNPYSQPYSLR